MDYLDDSMGTADPPDVVVADLRMPGMSGMQVLESVRTRSWNVPVVLISAFGDDEARRRARSLGASAFLEKPIDLAQLTSTLHHTTMH
jgi:CheY-like chemotaxis protein